MKDESVVMIGAGGHGKSVLNILWQMGLDVEVVIDGSPEKCGKDLLGIPIVSYESSQAKEKGRKAVIAIGDNATRKSVAELFSHLEWVEAISPLATVYRHAKVGKGSVIFPGTIIGADAVVGEHAIVGAHSGIAHDSYIGDFTHVAAGVMVGGGAQVMEGAFLTIGSNVIPGVKIGSWAMLGAGATAMRDIPDQAKAYAPPAKVYNSQS